MCGINMKSGLYEGVNYVFGNEIGLVDIFHENCLYKNYIVNGIYHNGDDDVNNRVYDITDILMISYLLLIERSM